MYTPEAVIALLSVICTVSSSLTAIIMYLFLKGDAK